MTIPNQEISELYQKLVISAIGKTFSSMKLEKLLNALIVGNVLLLTSLLEEFIGSLCSCHDLPKNDLERSLHLFVLGLLASLSGRYTIKSNLESGTGRYDILMYPKKPNDPGIIIEFKKGKDLKLEKLADLALKQIKTNKYESQIREFGYMGKILCYGMASFKKYLAIKMEEVF